MKPLKKILAVLAAAGIAVSSAFPASADNITEEEMNNASLVKSAAVNAPYLNISLDNGSTDTSGLTFTLKKDGKEIGKINGSMTSLNLSSSSGMYDITGAASDSDLNNICGQKAFTEVDLNTLANDAPAVIYRYNAGTVNAVSATFDALPNDTVYYGSQLIDIVDTMTVPAGTFVVSVSSRAAARGESTSFVQLQAASGSFDESAEKVYFNNNPGDHKLSAVPGGYAFRFNSAGNLIDNSAVIGSAPRKYVKVRIPVSSLFPVSKDPGTGAQVMMHNGKYYDVGNVTEGRPYVMYTFISGGVATADTPDENGNLYIWMTDDDLKAAFYTDYSDGAGNAGIPVDLPFAFKKIQLFMTYPKTGVTIYNVPDGNYSVEVNDSSYKLSGNTLNVTNMSTLQQMSVKVSKTTAVTEKPKPDAGTTTTAAPAISSPDETSSTASDEESSSGQEETSSQDGTQSSSSGTADSVTSSDTASAVTADNSSAQDESRAPEEEKNPIPLKMIIIICVVSLVALSAIIAAVILIRRDRHDDDDD